MRMLLAAALLCVGVPAGNAATTKVIYNDTGGPIVKYIERIKRFKAQGGTHVKITGPCTSACLLWLHKDFGLEYCATRKAVLGFHMPYAVNKRGVVVSTATVVAQNHRIGNYVMEGMPTTLRQLWKDRNIPDVSNGAKITDALYVSGMDAVRALGKCR